MIAIIVVMIARALGRILGALAETALRRMSPVLAARSRLILSTAVLGIGVIIALQQIGISTDIILILVAALAFGTALGTALAFGLGSVPVARQVAAGRHVANRYQPGDRVRVGTVEGTIESIGLATTRVIVPGAAASDVPNEEFLHGAVAVTPGG
jgi:small-conductance mechanosensitive channel